VRTKSRERKGGTPEISWLNGWVMGQEDSERA